MTIELEVIVDMKDKHTDGEWGEELEVQPAKHSKAGVSSGKILHFFHFLTRGLPVPHVCLRPSYQSHSRLSEVMNFLPLAGQ